MPRKLLASTALTTYTDTVCGAVASGRRGARRMRRIRCSSVGAASPPSTPVASKTSASRWSVAGVSVFSAEMTGSTVSLDSPVPAAIAAVKSGLDGGVSGDGSTEHCSSSIQLSTGEAVPAHQVAGGAPVAYAVGCRACSGGVSRRGVTGALGGDACTSGVGCSDGGGGIPCFRIRCRFRSLTGTPHIVHKPVALKPVAFISKNVCTDAAKARAERHIYILYTGV